MADQTVVPQTKPGPLLEPGEAIHVLLAEYTSLRTEITNRVNNTHVLLTAFAAFFVFTFGTSSDSQGERPWMPFAFAVSLITLFAARVAGDMLLASERIRQIEDEVNNRAQETLLVWENNWSAKRGLLFRRPIRIATKWKAPGDKS